MDKPEPADRPGRHGGVTLAGAVASLVVAVALYTRFSIGGGLSRDEAIYTYGGQQLSHGVAPYAGVFDPKGPLSTLIAGVAAAVAHVVGQNDIYWIRAAFFACACLTVLAVYLLAADLWHSPLAGVVAAVVFASFNGFAQDALAGPDAKTPGVLFAVLSMWLLARRQWLLGAFAGSLAFLVWQPLAIYPLVAVVVAAVNSRPRRRHRAFWLAVAGAATPLVVTTVYFTAVGALGKFYETAFVFPATGGVKHGKETVSARLTRIAHVIHVDYRVSGVLIWIGVVLLLLAVGVRCLKHRRDLRQALRDPLVCIVLVTLLAEVGYATIDFQGYPDMYPLLPYPALGMGAAAAAVVTLVRDAASRRIATAAVLAAAAVLTGFSWSWFTDVAPVTDEAIRAQQADACAVERMLGPGGRLYSLGDPTPLVMTHQRNPDRFIYLGSGLDEWKVAHTQGGFHGWTEQIQAANAAVITMNTWHGALEERMVTWLEGAGYRPHYVGFWRVFLTPEARARARLRGVRLTPHPTGFATGTAGRELPAKGCS